MNILQNKLRITHYALLIFAFLFIFYTNAYAQDDTPTDDDVNEVANQLYCPVCENRPLDTCPTEACHQWRELIRTQLAQGMTEEQIKQYFVDQYGDRVLAEPPRTGLNWLIYILPPVLILLGALVLFKNFQAWTKPKEVVSTPNMKRSGKSSNDDYVNQLEEELKKRK